jgi:hypothetical protein
MGLLPFDYSVRPQITALRGAPRGRAGASRSCVDASALPRRDEKDIGQDRGRKPRDIARPIERFHPPFRLALQAGIDRSEGTSAPAGNGNPGPFQTAMLLSFSRARR